MKTKDGTEQLVKKTLQLAENTRARKLAPSLLVR
jgi:hypothetical protein